MDEQQHTMRIIWVIFLIFLIDMKKKKIYEIIILLVFIKLTSNTFVTQSRFLYSLQRNWHLCFTIIEKNFQLSILNTVK